MTDNGIDAIVNGYMEVNSICIPAGHYRVEEGSEHYLFYAMEKKYQRSFIHGHIVGLGVYIMSRLQQNKWEEVIYQVMDMVGLSCLCRILASAITPFIALYYVNNNYIYICMFTITSQSIQWYALTILCCWVILVPY